jgi:hypothetical protein
MPRYFSTELSIWACHGTGGKNGKILAILHNNSIFFRFVSPVGNIV